MVIIEIENWLGNKVAILEENNDAIYLYSYSKESEVKALWVANSREVLKPNGIKDDMENGLPPYMPADLCNEFSYITDFEDDENWELQWGLDQNSIAVWYKDKIVAVMPEWSGFKGFFGYSIGANCENELAWPLSLDNMQVEKFTMEREFLVNWTTDLWVKYQESLLELYDSAIEGEGRYFAIDGGKWPPKGLRYISQSVRHHLFTIGVSILPMPSFGMGREENVEDFRRIELGIIFEGNSDFQVLGEYLSAQSTYPWYWGTHFDKGHTIPCSQLNDLGSKMTHMLLVEKANFLPDVKLPEFDSSNVRLLYMVPIYDSEQKFAEENSSSQLIELLESNDRPLNIFRECLI